MPQLERFDLRRNPQTGDVRLTAVGLAVYAGILKNAFPKILVSEHFGIHGEFHGWGLKLRKVGVRDEERLRLLCRLLQKAILIRGNLDQCFALGMHSKRNEDGTIRKAEFGELVYAAKPYNRGTHPGSLDACRRLAVRLARFVKAHPTYGRADVLVPVPPSNPDKDFDLPTVLVQEMSSPCGVPFEVGVIRKTRVTAPMKSCTNAAEKLRNVQGAYVASSAAIRGRSVILVDDICQSGATLNEVAKTLREAGAAQILGLVATKTLKGVRP